MVNSSQSVLILKKDTKSGGPPLIETRSLEVGNCSEKSLNSDDDEKDNNNNNNDDNKTSPPLIGDQDSLVFPDFSVELLQN